MSSTRLGAACAAAEIPVELSGRPKHIFSIWKKMKRKRVDFEQVFDVRGACAGRHGAAVLRGARHRAQPVATRAGEFDDYIAHPKPNGYRSLHTAVVGDDGQAAGDPGAYPCNARTCRAGRRALEIQRKQQHDDELERRIEWMRRWLEQQDDDAAAARQQRRDNEFEARQIYVLSPQGKVVELPAGRHPSISPTRSTPSVTLSRRGSTATSHRWRRR